MNIEEFKRLYVGPFRYTDWIFWKDKGFIVWRVGTGHNVELLHIKTFKKRQGIGRSLVRGMINELKENPPYHSIFGFTRVDNEEAHNFYKAIGFELQDIGGVYKDGRCKLFWAPFENLVEKFEDTFHGEQDGPNPK